MQARVGLVQTMGKGGVDIDIGAGREDDLRVFRTLGEGMLGREPRPEIWFDSLRELSVLSCFSAICVKPGDPGMSTEQEAISAHLGGRS
jgi:hypothetical protein